MKNKHSLQLLVFGAVAILSASAFASLSSGSLHGQAANGCVGMPYGTPGCPVKASSSSARPYTCGNAIVDQGEECDLGAVKNGFSNCTKDCKILYCGDGLISPALKEECEPESEEVYGLDPATGELTIEVRYLAPTCGALCTVPTCDKNGVCTGGCKRSFQEACPAGSSKSSVAAGVQPTQTTSNTQPVAGVPSCGNFIVDSGEQCDDGNKIDTDACSNLCRIGACGDSIVQVWEQCDDGNRIDADACSNTCKSPACGDGTVQLGEECDDGNQVSNDSCSNACKFPRCGDQVIQQNEECDDGNKVNSDSCSNECRAPRCGDAIVQIGEECDDGNKVDTDMCTTQCVMARCGDSVTQQSEECDDGNKVNNDSCNNLCKLPACGNGIREGAEICDDGNQNNNDSCSNECQRPICGDGLVQPGEFCDDGNQNNDDNCTTQCRVPTCGDGLLHTREECDNGRDNSDVKSDACRKDCREARCGDGIIDSAEECDGGDLCSPECKLLKPAAALIQDTGFSSYALYVIIMAGFGSAAVLAFVLRRQLHAVVAKIAGDKVADSLDDIPLDQIEMPWHKW